ncbi:energy transducer TonB [Dysgonomonas sp. 521]|uniref:energy transducer TonB n=1 Tax=Dysgonomonas sp. 521 TaxID=2302932 RepID=UPI0013D6F26C|nr:energy transducer TonB [Dysgonomonas sp. 521]NDV96541.1 energy transducer TonB [Dysgonomonas sp. 521]
MKYLLLILLSSFSVITLSQNSLNEAVELVPDISNKRKTYSSPDSLPSFPGGHSALYNFITRNKKHPIIEHECYEGCCCHGRVTIRFIVTKEGKIESPEIVKGVSPILDKEALRVVNIMPDWIPAKHNGENVDAYYILPIVFRRD